MYQLTYKDRQKFESISNEILNDLKKQGIIFNIDYEMLCSLVETAKDKNKLNNYLLKNDYKDDVWNHECFDLETKQLVKIVLKPSKNNTVKKLFIYEVLKSQYVPKQTFTNYK